MQQKQNIARKTCNITTTKARYKTMATIEKTAILKIQMQIYEHYFLGPI